MFKDILFLISPMIFSYFMFVKSKNTDRDENFLHEKLEKIYLPIYLQHTSEILIRDNFVILEAKNYYEETFKLVDEILVKNLYYLPTTTQKYFLQFHVYLINEAFVVSETNISYLIQLYNLLYASLIKEYKDICNKLNLPEPVEKFD